MTERAVLPESFHAVDALSLRAQRTAVWLTRIRLGALVVASLGTSVPFVVGRVSVGAAIALLGFAVGLLAEVALGLSGAEDEWYRTRAVAESIKTLAWRYAVRGAPFDVEDRAARAEFRVRVTSMQTEVLRIAIPTDSLVTPEMARLRDGPFDVRRQAYVDHRTASQQRWYADKASSNHRRARQFRMCAVSLELTAIVLTVAAFAWSPVLGWAGAFATAGAGTAAWMSFRQHSPVAAAYRIAAAELGVQRDVLLDYDEARWGAGVADAEEAISREHTMWTASRLSSTSQHEPG